MNLADVLPMKDALPITKSGELMKALEVAHDFRYRSGQIDELLPYSDFGGIEEHNLRNMRARLMGKVSGFRVEVLGRTGSLPLALQTEDDYLTRLARTPKVELRAVREVADKLGFAVMPFSYLDKRSYEKESSQMQMSIGSFVSECSQAFQIYVLAPVDFYSIKQHVMAKEDLPIYAGHHADQAFMALTMALPMFREMIDDISHLNKAQAKTQKGLKDLDTRLQELAVKVEQLQKNEIAREAKEREMVAEIERLRREQASFIARDPMLLALPKGSSILEDGFGFVGPCWGPDFPDIIATLRDLLKIEGQRVRVNILGARWHLGGRTGNIEGWEKRKNDQMETLYQEAIGAGKPPTPTIGGTYHFDSELENKSPHLVEKDEDEEEDWEEEDGFDDEDEE